MPVDVGESEKPGVTSSGSSDISPYGQRGECCYECDQCREANGFTIAAAAKLVDLSASALQRVEAGQTQKVRKQDVRALCEVYGVGAEELGAATDLATLARTQSWYHAYGGLYSEAFNMYTGLEAAARRLVTYHEHIPGLLQTADYARAVISAFPGFTGAADVDRRVEHRMRRQAIVTRKTHPVALEVLLHESALRRVIRPPFTLSYPINSTLPARCRGSSLPPDTVERASPEFRRGSFSCASGHFARVLCVSQRI
ncbi:helix-turn-helix domain-containing protein [Nocardia huaxiensis]|uniref:Helix-turn-helix domain-containing protein n=1 Tax=Nocardia huaxiensis TaxID=2755382 RepID=A0A7D6V600_9NOCA|nr:helix-turn-helix domain-containing protein [Nocardia huaxiensis]